MTDEQSAAALPYCQMGGFAGLLRQGPEMIAAYGCQHAPVVFAEQMPDGRADDIVLSTVGIGQKTAALQGIGQAEHAAAIDLQKVGQIAERNGFLGLCYCLENRQSTIKTLYGWSLQNSFFHMTDWIVRVLKE